MIHKKSFLSYATIFILQHHMMFASSFVPRQNLWNPLVIKKKFDGNIALASSQEAIEDEAKIHSKDDELWLDLRGTAVHPQAATEYLMEQITEENGEMFSDSSLIDKVLISNESFEMLVNSADSYLEDSDVIYLTGPESDTVALNRNGMSIPYGNVLPMPTEASMAVEDPIKAMEVLSADKWLIFVNEKQLDEQEEATRIEAVADFLDIATAPLGINLAATELDSGLLIGAAIDDLEKSDGNGGIAIACSTKSSIVKLACKLRWSQQGGSTSITDSGIIIQNDASDDSPPPVRTALVIPFDLTLWTTAALVYGEPDQYIAE